MLKQNDPLVKTFETVKKNYLTAKVMLDLAYEKVHEENAPNWEAFEKEADGEDREEVLLEIIIKMDQVEEKYKIEELRKLRDATENELIETAETIIKKISPERWPEIAPVFDKKNRLYVGKKLIDLTLKLDPTK